MTKKTNGTSNKGGPRPGSGAPKVIDDATNISVNLPGDLVKWINDQAPKRGRSTFVAQIIRTAKENGFVHPDALKHTEAARAEWDELAKYINETPAACRLLGVLTGDRFPPAILKLLKQLVDQEGQQ
jgi:hypothetical protein